MQENVILSNFNTRNLVVPCVAGAAIDLEVSGQSICHHGIRQIYLFVTRSCFQTSGISNSVEIQTGPFPADIFGKVDNPTSPPPSCPCLEDIVAEAISHCLSSLTFRITGFLLTITSCRLHSLGHLNLRTAQAIVPVPNGTVDVSRVLQL